MSTTTGATRGAILLAGGRASRMGGAAKPLLEVSGAPLLAHALAAARDAGCAPLTVVGPEAPGIDAPDAGWIREDPPFGGPAAGVVAALAAWRAAPPAPEPVWTLVLACDLPRARAAVSRLMGALPLLPADTDGVCLADASSRPQWLTGVYRTSALRAAASRLPRMGRDAAMRALLDDLAVAVVADPDGTAQDIDTWEDLKRFTKESP